MISLPACVRWKSIVFLLLLMLGVCVGRQLEQQRKPDMHPRHFQYSSSRMTIANMTCNFFQQPLNHFIPRNTGPTYKQRYCLYNGFMEGTWNETTHPIFLYTGNESPLEQYINHTGLMWELAPHHKAQVVFMEHRYEGKSLAQNLSEKCMSYSSSIQALADYVTLLNHLNPNAHRPVICFGGSYGGMLSSWLRMKYPNIVAGAIAASAPIWGLPTNNTSKTSSSIDGASRVVARGVSMPYPPTKVTSRKNYCSSSMLASWPLMQFLAKSVVGREFLSKTFRLCNPLKSSDSVDQLLEWAQSPWFDMAEGSFPYPSSYIPFSLHMGKHNLPPWPVQAACWRKSRLHQDWGVSFDYHNKSDVKYTITYGDSGIVLNIDWDTITLSNRRVSESAIESATVKGLLSSVRDAVAVWFNITKDLKCFNVTPAENEAMVPSLNTRLSAIDVSRRATLELSELRDMSEETNDTATCLAKMKAEGSWPSLSCNEDVNMPITLARGIGGDFYWPPDFPRGTSSYADIVDAQGSDYSCDDPNGLFGYPPKADPWGEWLDLYYGSRRMESHSNIVFSNGLLDPWSSGGVYAPGMDPNAIPQYKGPMVQNITTDGSVIALIIEFGGHHTDLMYSDRKDPQCVKDARRIENDFITRWIQEWNEERQRETCFRG